MNTSMINKLMEVIPGFRGTIGCDLLPRASPNTSFVVNTDTSTQRGEHWVAVHVDDKNFYFFDSFGRAIDEFDEPFISYLNKAAEGFVIKTSSQNLQYIFSDFCGLWCIYYLWCKFTSYKYMFRHFSRDNLENDEKLYNIMDFLNRILPNYLAREFNFDSKQRKQLLKIKQNLKQENL